MLGLIRLFYDAYLRLAEDDGWAISSHIALSILTSLFPFLIFVTAIAGFFGSQQLADEAAHILFETWPERVAAPIAGEIHNVLTNAHGGVLTIGVVLAIYFSSSAVEALRTGLNRAYDVHETRPWWLLRLQSIFYTLLCAFGLLTLAFLVVLEPLIWNLVLRYAPSLRSLDQLVTFARFGVVTVVLLFLLFLIHEFLPGGQRRLIDMLPGIVLTFVLWVVAGIAFGSYLAEFARNYVNTYAGLASVMIAIVFLYMLAAIFIFGGELNAALMRAKDRRSAEQDRDMSETEQSKSVSL
jgi:membrane protein